MQEAEALSQLINGYRGTALIGVAARLRLADHIAGGATSTAELAEAAGVRPDMLSHLVRALVSLRIVEIEDTGNIRLAQMGELLRAAHPSAIWNSAVYAATVSGPAFEGLYDSLHDGVPAFVHKFGRLFYEWIEDSAELSVSFDKMLRLPGFNKRIVQMVRGDVHGTVYDIGGGDGSLLVELLDANPQCHGVLFEIPDPRLSPANGQSAGGLTGPLAHERLTSITGDFLEEVPPGGDFYILARVLANWGDEDAEHILANCAAALSASARLLIIEQLMPDRACANQFIALGNMDLLVNFGGHLRTTGEFDQLFASVGLRSIRRRFLTEPDKS